MNFKVLKMLKFGGKVLKLSMLMGALILAGLVQGALDAQDVLAPQGGQRRRLPQSR